MELEGGVGELEGEYRNVKGIGQEEEEGMKEGKESYLGEGRAWENQKCEAV